MLARIFLILIVSSTLTFFNACGPSMKANEGAQFLNSQQATEVLTGDPHGSLQFKTKTSVKPLYANRIYMKNLLEDIFGPTFAAEFNKDIGLADDEFGAPFGMYDTVNISNSDCNKHTDPEYSCNTASIDMSAAPTIGVSAAREGRRLSACQRGVSDDKSLLFVLQRIDTKATLEAPPAFTMENYTRVFRLFFRAKATPDPTFFDNFSIIKNKEKEDLVAWEKIILGMCLSPHWQVL